MGTATSTVQVTQTDELTNPIKFVVNCEDSGPGEQLLFSLHRDARVIAVQSRYDGNEEIECDCGNEHELPHISMTVGTAKRFIDVLTEMLEVID